MDLPDLLSEIERGAYDPTVSGDVVEFYCLREDHGVNPEPRLAADAAETGAKNPTYGGVLSAAETAFDDRPAVGRARRAGWLVANPVPTPTSEADGDVVPGTVVEVDHVADYARRRGRSTDATVWTVNTKWVVDVPDGYSVLYAHPFGHDDAAFTTLPGVVDADRFPHWLRVPVVVHGADADLQFDDPLAQLVPFERSEGSVDASVGVAEEREPATTHPATE